MHYIRGRKTGKGITTLHSVALEYMVLLLLPKMKATPVRKTLNKRFSLIDSERRYKRACKQVNLLNSKMSDLVSRILKPANTPYQRSLRYGLGLRLSLAQAFRDLYYEYAYSKAQTVADIWRKCQHHHGRHVRLRI